jgi:hypothetical protein
MAIDAFLKFEGLGGEAQKLGNDFDRLGDSFSDLGGAFIKLVDAGTSTDTNSLKADFAAQIKHDVFAIGADFHKIGDAFIKLAGPLDTFADAVVKFTDQFKVTPSEGGDQPSLAADFLAYQNDLKVTGTDFLAAAPDIKSDTPTESLSLNFSNISVDYKNQGNDANQIATALTEFVRINKLSDSPVGEAFLKFSDEWKVVAADYLKLSSDFATIAEDAGSTSDSGPIKFDQLVFKFQDAFVTLAQDLKVTDHALGSLGGDFHKLADTLQNAGPSTPPSFKLG